MKKALAAVSLALILLLMPGSVTVAGEIRLQWDAVAGAEGYRIHYGTSPGSYTQSVSVWGQTEATLQNLQNCTEIYMAVRTLDGGSESAAYSNEISGWSRPVVSTTAPIQMMQGDQLWVTLAGANFDPSADVQLLTDNIPLDENGLPLVRVEAIEIESCNQIEVLLSVESSARGVRSMEIGSRSLEFEIINPDSVFGSHSRSFNVEFNPARCDVNRSDSSTLDRVDGKDLTWMAYAHGSNQGEPRYNPDADLDGDGMVDGTDLAMLASDFGNCWDGSDWGATACP